MNTINTDQATLGNPPVGTTHSRTRNGSAGQQMARFPLESGKILLPVDFSAASLWTLRHTAHLAETYGSSILLLHVVDLGSFMNDLRNAPWTRPEDQLLRDAEIRLRRLAVRELPAIELVLLPVQSGRVGPVIIRTAREARCDLIVLTVDNHHVVERIRHFLFGSTAAWVARHAPCPALTLSLPKNAPGLPDYGLGHQGRNGVLQQLERAA